MDEPGSDNGNADVTVGIPQPPSAEITVRVEAGGTGETATPGSGMDYTFTGMNLICKPVSAEFTRRMRPSALVEMACSHGGHVQFFGNRTLY